MSHIKCDVGSSTHLWCAIPDSKPSPARRQDEIIRALAIGPFPNGLLNLTFIIWYDLHRWSGPFVTPSWFLVIGKHGGQGGADTIGFGISRSGVRDN